MFWFYLYFFSRNPVEGLLAPQNPFVLYGVLGIQSLAREGAGRQTCLL
ncbi:4499_t:CDS:2 [Paraglomus brasilianum]|uniref:4499_t:CDS:1 n=1 Tax=Paraglomus brasilianum TaxID=144538 RepID=A0A9N8WDV4_9GLOM|nr:4499_t:CDS:2 [Paraglomus brasilianum]